MERARGPLADPAGGPRLPRTWARLAARYPEVGAAYDALREACDGDGAVDPRTMAIVKLAVSVGAGADRTIHAHTRKALRAGVDPAVLRQVALAALPTIGLPAALDALAWIEESIAEAPRPGDRER